MEFTHMDAKGNAIMVDVSEKAVTKRTAVAVGRITMSEECFSAVKNGTAKKGDVLGVAQVAGIMATKKTSELIPLCHLLNLTKSRVEFALLEEENAVEATCTVSCEGKTGVEMEALTGATVALLTVYDMCKAIDKDMVISQVRLMEKHGGKSGDFYAKKPSGMKKLTALLLAFLMSLVLTACGGGEQEKKTELTVFAAASLTETLTELGQRYEATHDGVTLTFNFDSSGTLETQIEEGAECDLFLSAGQKQMNELEEEQLIVSETRLDLLENKVVLVSPEGKVTDFEDMAQQLQSGRILLAMGNEEVPVGQYTRKLLDYFGLEEAELASAGCITYGSNVKEVTTQVCESSVDCGIIYHTDAVSAGLTVVDEAQPEMCGQVIYPAAVTGSSSHSTDAEEFLRFLTTEEAMEVFAAVGFSAVK